jgi:tRNA dimethylallyltransferase
MKPRVKRGVGGAAAGLTAEAGRAEGARAVVIGILGATAVGKTAVGVAVACRLGVDVISCDSMQLYRGFPVLTNQPTAQERQGVVHHLVGVLEPDQDCTAAAYAALARPLIETSAAERAAALLVGGTGLYMRAALAPLAARPAGDPANRAALESEARVHGPEALHARLAVLDEAAAADIDPHNVRRLIRALESLQASPRRPWSGRDDLWHPVYPRPTLVVGLTLPREDLYGRIDRRARAIVEGAGLEEVRAHFRLCHSCGSLSPWSEEPSAAAAACAGIRNAIGFRELCQVVSGERDREEATTAIAAATRRYARRQSTWLRKVGGAVMIDVRDRAPSDVADQIVALSRSRAAGEEAIS